MTIGSVGVLSLAGTALIGVAAVALMPEAQQALPSKAAIAKPIVKPAVTAGQAARTDARIDGTIAYLSNNAVKLGIDLKRGGAIVYLADPKDGRNLVNNHDLGRQIQQSYYSGPHPYGRPSGVWANAGWNPIASGDAFNNRATATVRRPSGNSLYSRVIPYQWALRKVRCECLFESWITLEGNQILVRNRLTNHRADHTQYPADTQELPAVYFNGFLRDLVTYAGPQPYTDAPVTRLATVWPPRSVSATEYWTAALDGTGRGVGVLNSSTMAVDVGFAGPAVDGGTHDDPTAYIAPRSREILDHDIVYESSYRLVLGTLPQIRAAAKASRPTASVPSYRFQKDRQGWRYVNATDTGWPITGRLAVRATAPDPQLLGPERGFAAHAAPALWVTAAFHDAGETAQFFWSTLDKPGFSEAQSLKFRVISDGRMRRYMLPLAKHPEWKGMIRTLRLDPPGRDIDLCAVTAQPISC